MEKTKKFLYCFVGLVLLLGVGKTVQDGLINFGVNIYNSKGSSSGGFAYTQVPGGITGDNNDEFIIGTGGTENISFSFVAGYAPGSGITNADLLINAADVGETAENHDNTLWQFLVYGDDNPGGTGWMTLGNFSGTAHSNTEVPLLAGSFGTPVHTPKEIEILPGNQTVLSDDPKIDGGTLPVPYTPSPSQVPEPGSLFFLGCGLIGLAVTRMRKKH